MQELKNYLQFILSILFDLLLDILGIKKDLYYKKYDEKRPE
jgi:hypothetical protein